MEFHKATLEDDFLWMRNVWQKYSLDSLEKIVKTVNHLGDGFHHIEKVQVMDFTTLNKAQVMDFTKWKKC